MQPNPDLGETAYIAVRDLTMAFADRVIQRDLNFAVRRGEIFVVMGGSGCGKSTLLRHLLGLQQPAKGAVFYAARSLWESPPSERAAILRKTGVLFQSGALWSSMTLVENVALPLGQFTDLPPGEIEAIARLKLALVGLAGFEEYYPAELSGGMQKRAGLARAMALDPDILFFDEPSAGLDPLSAKRLDDLILSLRDNLGATIVVVTHELASIFAIADNSIFLDAESQTIIATGNPRDLLADSTDVRVREFLTRGRHYRGDRGPDRADEGRV
ncbi:ABC transporter ATP-binding protein [Methylotetracoccus oryzae]|uniref:ABC transporter ATP-binding protein n=1 Tax=Methylotetracoccus oryzae TaxID=1919059 RepID=UPI00111ACEB1|nr:ATP-binding cassette domain-containing protein [Methylotetracoccus oryzae]